MCIRVVCVRFVHYDLNSSACTVVIVFATLHVCTCVSYTGHEDFHSMDERVRVIVQYLRDGDVHTRLAQLDDPRVSYLVRIIRRLM